MKTKEELNALKEKVEALNKKLAELTDEELEQVSGGKNPETLIVEPPIAVKCPSCSSEFATEVIPAKCPSCGLVFYP